MKTSNISYPLGFLGISIINTLFTQWIVYYHAEKGLHSGTIIGVGTVLFVGYVFQGILSPLIGHWVDHNRLNRKKIILLATFPLAAIFYSLFKATSFYISAPLMLLFNLFFVLMIQPYMSLLPTIEPDKDRRVIFSLIGALLAVGGAILALSIAPIMLNKFSFDGISWMGAIALIGAVWVPILFITNPHQTYAKGDTASFSRAFLKFSRKVYGKRPVRLFLLGNGMTFIVVQAMTILTPFVSNNVLGKDSTFTLNLNIALSVGMLASTITLIVFSKKLDMLKLQAFLTKLCSIVLFFLCVSTLLLEADTLVVIWVIAYGLLGAIVLGAMVCPPLILSQFNDEDPGGNEGLLFGLNGFGINVGNAIASQVVALLLFHHIGGDTEKQVLYVLVFALLAAIISAISLHEASRKNK